MPRHDGQARRHFSLDDVEVGAADAAGFHRDLDFPRAGCRARQLGGRQGTALGRSRALEAHAAHRKTILGG